MSKSQTLGAGVAIFDTWAAFEQIQMAEVSEMANAAVVFVTWLVRAKQLVETFSMAWRPFLKLRQYMTFQKP